MVSGTIAFTSFAGTAAFASDNSNVVNAQTERVEDHFSVQEGYTLISEETYVDENGFQVIDRSYVKDVAEPCDLERTEKTVSKSKLFSLSGTEWAELWVEGTFAYYEEAKTCFIKKADSGYTVLHGHATVVSTSQSKDYNQGGDPLGLTNKYAYIKRELTLDNGLWQGVHTFSLEVRVYSDGDVKVNSHSS